MGTRRQTRDNLEAAADLIIDHLFEEGSQGRPLEGLAIIAYIHTTFDLPIKESSEVARIAAARYKTELESTGYHINPHTQSMIPILGPKGFEDEEKMRRQLG